MSECLARSFEAIKLTDRREDMRRIGALSPACGEQLALAKLREHLVEEQLLHPARDEAGAELTEDTAIETGIGQCEGQGIFPVDAGTDSLGCLTVRQPFDVLQDRDEREAPRCLGRLTTPRKEGREGGIDEHDADRIAHPDGTIAFGEGSAGDTGSLVGDGTDGLRLQRHGGPPRYEQRTR